MGLIYDGVFDVLVDLLGGVGGEVEIVFRFEFVDGVYEVEVVFFD